MDWKKRRKIDGHVHILPDERVAEHRFYDSGPWSRASLEDYLYFMEENNVEKAIVLPTNYGKAYFEDPTDTNRYLYGLMEAYPDRFICFADIVNQGGYFSLDMPKVIEEAYNMGLKGLKIHPSNLGIAIDSLDMVPIFRKACDLNMPIMIHSYPYGGQDFDLCAPDRIHRMARVFPDARIIISHMGGCRWMDALEASEYIDISTFLPELTRIYGIEISKRILHEFGADRLIFATDYPQVHGVEFDKIYDTYFKILDQMDFSEEELEKIAYGNMARILGID